MVVLRPSKSEPQTSLDDKNLNVSVLDDAKQRAPCDLSIPKSYSFVGK